MSNSQLRSPPAKIRLTVLSTFFLASCAPRPALDESRLVDLTHPFNERTVY